MRTGCALCWPDDARDAWDADTRKRRAELVDESHFHVTLLVCSACGQNFVSVFTETIDWVAGNDPQYWSLLPITRDEAEALERGTPTEESLDRLGHGRRSLRREFGADDEEPHCGWSNTLRTGPHD